MEPATSTFGLIERIRQGDCDAFSPLFEKYRRRLAVLIHYRLGPRLSGLVEVDDILQETMLDAFRRLDRFSYQSPGSFFRWLCRIADHVIADAARYHGREKRRASELVRFRTESNPEGAEPAATTTPSRILARDEKMRALLADLDTLPADYREVILLARLEGLSTAEVAEKMNRSREAVALLLHRALKRLREIRGLQGSK